MKLSSSLDLNASDPYPHVHPQHDDCPPNSSCTRGEIGVSGWTFHEITDERGRAVTECKYVGQADVNAPHVPTWLIKKCAACVRWFSSAC